MMVAQRVGEMEQEFLQVRGALEKEAALLRRNLEMLQQESAGGSREQEREGAVIVAQEEYGRRMEEREKEVEALKSDAMVLQAHVERFASMNEKLTALASESEARAVHATQVCAYRDIYNAIHMCV
jgi:hypothetical protein